MNAAEIPYLFTLDEMVAWLAERDRELTSDELEVVRWRLGRNEGPVLLDWLVVQYGLVPDEVLTEQLGSVWSSAEWPEDSLNRATWLDLFDRAGYTEDGKPADRPADPIRLYRGSPEVWRERMAWTTDPTTAAWFASRWQVTTGRSVPVWSAMVEPRRLQCALLDSENGRGESEYVVDPHGLDIARWSG